MKKASGLKCNFQKLLKLFGFKKDQSEVSKVYVDRSGDAIINHSKNALDYRGGVSLITKPSYVIEFPIRDIPFEHDGFPNLMRGSHGIYKPISGGLSRDEFYRLLKASLEETRSLHRL